MILLYNVKRRTLTLKLRSEQGDRTTSQPWKRLVFIFFVVFTMPVAHQNIVTSLESVVIQLQDSCRESRSENIQLRHEISRLRYENREREKYWRAFINPRKSPSILSNLPDSFSYSNPSSFVEQQNNTNNTSQLAALPDRPEKYPTYSWQIPALSNTAQSQSQSQSPSYIQSPSIAPPFSARFPQDDRKVALDLVLNSAPYVFPGTNSTRYQNVPESIPNSRSMSPTTSASSATYQLPFQADPASAQEHTDFHYRAQSLPQSCQDVTLHGGIADISLAGQHPDSVRYRFIRRSNSDLDNQDLPMLPQNDTSSHHHEDNPSRLRASRRNIAHPYRRSQSPGPTPLSSTVAVIKAQAFGALRRTRAKTKRATDSAARVAQDVLEARGIGVGPVPSNENPARLYQEEDDDVGKP